MKSGNRAYAKHQGKRVYFGRYDDPKSRKAYDDWIEELKAEDEGSSAFTTTVSRLCVEFLKFAQEHYRDSDGNQTKELDNYRSPIRLMVSMFGNCRCAEFGPKKLLALRDEFAKRHVRTIANRQMFRIRKVFKWGVAREMVPGDVLVRLQAVEGLQAGRGQARESDGVKPAPQADIDAALPFMTSPVSAMVRLQLVTGARPSEVRLMTAGEIDQTGEVWIYRPRKHKNAWRQKSRQIFIGPKGQDILFPFLLGRKPGEFLFRPIDGREEYVSRAFKEGAKASVRNSTGENSPYSLSGYISSIKHACKRAKVPVWSPGQLRHNAATMINQRFGDIDASRTVLGHTSKSTSEIYAERDMARAMEIALAMG